MPHVVLQDQAGRGPLQSWRELRRQLDELKATLYLDGAAPVRAKVKQIVPEYSSAPGPSAAKTNSETFIDIPGDPQLPPRFPPTAAQKHPRPSLQPWRDRVNPA